MESEENVKKKYVRRLLSYIWKINDTEWMQSDHLRQVECFDVL